jgi:hypothetical protein
MASDRAFDFLSVRLVPIMIFVFLLMSQWAYPNITTSKQSQSELVVSAIKTTYFPD